MDVKQAILVGCILGLVAGAVVWYLERFESERLHLEVRDYLTKFDAFRAWEAEHGGAGGS